MASRSLLRHSFGILRPFARRRIDASYRQPLPKSSFRSFSVHTFPSESDYHTVADECLEDIQDAVEACLEDEMPQLDFEITFASGVLTMVLPPHGTWVLNKQTPNQQIWWSSPLSGPRRYEFDFEEQTWSYTRSESQSLTLKESMKSEMEEIYNVKIDL